jgi:anti-anti-sigma factor
MSERPPIPPPSCIDTMSASLRFESGQDAPTTTQASIGRARAADAFALDWELPPRPVERLRGSWWSRSVGDAPRATGNASGDRPEAQNGELAIVIGRSLGTVVVRLAGPMDALAATRRAATLDDLIDGQGNLGIAVDLTAVRRIAPSGLRVFSAAASDLERRGGRLSLWGSRNGVLNALQHAGLGRFIGAPAGRSLSHLANRRAMASHPAGRGGQGYPQGGRNDRT